MDTRKTEIVVGTFVALGIAAMVTLALKVSSLTSLPGDASYHLKAKFDNIGGLKIRSPVKIGGVVIGRVANIELERQTLTPIVDIAINKDYDQLPTDTSAKINTAGLLGEQFISLSVGSDDSVFKDGQTITQTQSAMVLEDLISKYLFSDKSTPAAPAAGSESAVP